MKFAALLLLTTAASATGCAEDLPGPRPLTCDAPIAVTSYRIDAVAVPTSPSEAEDLGADLDGDRTIDNQLGNVQSAVLSAMGEPAPGTSVAAQLDARLADDLDWRLERSTCPTSGESRLALTDDLLPLGALIDLLGGGDAGWSPAAVALVEFAPDDTGLDGRIAAGLAPGYEDVYATAYARVLTDRSIRRDAFDNPDVDEVIDRMDRDGNREISEAELRASSLFVTLLRPDLDTDDDGTPDSLSMGIGFHATAVPTAP